MHIIAFDPVLDLQQASDLGIQKVDSLEEILENADIVSLHAPSTPATRHLINESTLSKMKPGSILINTARGSLVDETALASALKSGHLASAGLDVFEKEPIAADNPLLTLENIVLTDHIASHTWEGHHRLYQMAVNHALQALRGERPDCLLNNVPKQKSRCAY
jgi:phosphoglycerate dehydrogenase-like enzyme